MLNRKTIMTWFHLYIEPKTKQNKWTDKQNSNRLMDTEKRPVVAMGEAGYEEYKIGEREKEVQTCNYKIN